MSKGETIGLVGSFLSGKRAPVAENCDVLSQRCKEVVVLLDEEVIVECQNVEGHKKRARQYG